MKFDPELQSRLMPIVERRVGYAAAKNISKILDDLERNIHESGEKTLAVTIKLKFEAVSRSSLNLKLDIGWVRKTSYADKDFDCLTVDLQQPELSFQRQVKVVEWDDNHRIMQKIITHAAANNLKLLRIKNIGDPECREVQSHQDGTWHDHLLETTAEVEAVLQAIAQEGGMAYQGNELLQHKDFDFDKDFMFMPVVE
jgi:hypothetical protein